MNGKHETARALLELKVDKDAKDEVRNRMMMMMMMMMMTMMVVITIRVVTIMMIVGDDKGDSR